MAGFQDPVQVMKDYMAVLKLCFIMDGVYIWEFFISLNYEWDVIRGRRPYRRTIWIYSIARLTSLLSVVIDLIISMGGLPYCQTLVSLDFIFPYIALAFSSLLILIRISPIWIDNKLAVLLATGLWLTNVSFLIYGAVGIRSSMDPIYGSCAIVNIQSNKPTFISIFATDFALLLIMLVGLFRLRSPGGGWFDLGRLLWTQGVIWFSLATIAELLPVVFLCLDLNDAFSTMFMMPTLVTMTIAATRMYRFLAEFCSYTDVVVDSTIVRRSGRHDPRVNLAILTHDQLEVAAHATYDCEKYPASATGKDLSFVSMEIRETEAPQAARIEPS